MRSSDRIQEKRMEIQRIKEIPPLPLVGQRLLISLNNEDTTVDEITGIIAQDPALVARLLGLANSAFFGRSGKIKTIKEAIVRVLGFDMVKSLAFSIVMSGVFDAKKCRGFDLERYWSTAMFTAVLAGLLSQHLKTKVHSSKQHFYLCGLLHHLGLLALAHSSPEEMAQVFQAHEADPQRGLASCERDLLGADHRQAGGWLARMWQLPAEVVAVIEHHHDPDYRAEHWEVALFVGYCEELAKHCIGGTGVFPESPVAAEVLGISAGDLQTVQSRFQGRFEEIRQVARVIGL